jgi:hypothetical protein
MQKAPPPPEKQQQWDCLVALRTARAQYPIVRRSVPSDWAWGCQILGFEVLGSGVPKARDSGLDMRFSKLEGAENKNKNVINFFFPF